MSQVISMFRNERFARSFRNRFILRVWRKKWEWDAAVEDLGKVCAKTAVEFKKFQLAVPPELIEHE